MVNESQETLNIIEDMMEEQIISTEEADLKTSRGQVCESRDNRPGAARRRLLGLTSPVSRP